VSAEDALGHATGCSLTLGQAHEVPLASLLTFLTILPFWIVDDRGYASHAFHKLICGGDARPAIPPKRNERRSSVHPGSTATGSNFSGTGSRNGAPLPLATKHRPLLHGRPSQER
jgi:hypothetical protein